MDLVISNILAYVFISYSQVSITLTMKAKILLILIVVSFVKADGENCNIRGQCINAQISHLVTVSSQMACLQRCLSFDDCKWYTFHMNEDEMNCELFRTCESITSNGCSNCVSGQNTCPTENCQTVGFCLGTVIARDDYVTSRGSCNSECQKEPGCKYYSYSKGNRDCFLFENCPSIDETLVEFESSQVGCPVH